MAQPYYQPQSIAPILERGAAIQAPYLAQPSGLSQALPALGSLAQTGFNVAAQNQKKMNVLQAQQVYSDYLAKLDSGTATPQDHQQGYMAALSLGINPKPPTTVGMVDPSILSALQGAAGVNGPVKGTKENVAGLEKVAQLKKKPVTSDQNLTQDEMRALQGAMTRSNNPLPASMISFRGPRAKLMAQSLMSNPDWSPVAGESSLASAKAGASASARLTQGGSAQMTARTANAAREQLSILEDISSKFPRSNVQLMNTPIIKFDAQTMPEAQNWIIALNSFRNEYASALMRGNMPQGEAQREVAKSLPENITPRQLAAAIPLLRREIDALVKGQMTPATGKEGQGAAPNHSALLDKYGVP